MDLFKYTYLGNGNAIFECTEAGINLQPVGCNPSNQVLISWTNEFPSSQNDECNIGVVCDLTPSNFSSGIGE